VRLPGPALRSRRSRTRGSVPVELAGTLRAAFMPLNPLIPLSAHDDVARPRLRFDAILSARSFSARTFLLDVTSHSIRIRDPFQGICNAIPVCRQDRSSPPPRRSRLAGRSYLAGCPPPPPLPPCSSARNCRLTPNREEEEEEEDRISREFKATQFLRSVELIRCDPERLSVRRDVTRFCPSFFGVGGHLGGRRDAWRKIEHSLFRL